MVGFVAAAALIGRAVPPYLPVVTPKQEHLSAHKDAYTTLFLGTSIMYRNVVPEIFSKEMGRLGHEEPAFNFGAPHMTLAEARLILDRILAIRSSRLKTIVVDLALFVDSDRHNHFTSRHVWWHTPTETYLALQNDFAGTPRWDAAGVEVKALALNVTAIGRLSEIFQSRWDPAFRDKEEDDEDVDAEGYRPLEEVRTRSVEKRRADFLRGEARYEKEVAARRASPSKARKLGNYQRRMLERIVTRIREAGLTPVLYDGPNVNLPLRLGGEMLTQVPKLSFNDPVLYPDLYLFENRFDRSHLSADGARLFTEVLAGEYARRMYGGAPREDPPR